MTSGLLLRRARGRSERGATTVGAPGRRACANRALDSSANARARLGPSELGACPSKPLRWAGSGAARTRAPEYYRGMPIASGCRPGPRFPGDTHGPLHRGLSVGGGTWEGCARFEDFAEEGAEWRSSGWARCTESGECLIGPGGVGGLPFQADYTSHLWMCDGATVSTIVFAADALRVGRAVLTCSDSRFQRDIRRVDPLRGAQGCQIGSPRTPTDVRWKAVASRRALLLLCMVLVHAVPPSPGLSREGARSGIKNSQQRCVA